jgi:hypothetical protein
MLKGDVIDFLDEHEDEILRAVGEELEEVDRRIPEEQAFIDIKMRELGEELTRAILKAVKRFLSEY